MRLGARVIVRDQELSFTVRFGWSCYTPFQICVPSAVVIALGGGRTLPVFFWMGGWLVLPY